MNLASSIYPRKISVKVITALSALALLLAMTLATLPAKAAAGISLENTTVRPGVYPVISGSGFQVGERVDMWLTSPDGQVVSYGNTYTDSTGSFAAYSTQVAVDSSDTAAVKNGKTIDIAGTWYVTARGISSNTLSYASFTVVTPTLQASTYSTWNSMVTVTYSGTNFFPGEQVSLWVTDSTGKVIPVTYAWADGQGLLPAVSASTDSSSTTPLNTLTFAAGTAPYTLSAHGNTSGQTVYTQIK
ncbi:MAG TPA: hypothetical protein VH186_26020 [Chloroflexia bacterium]|nr:hypothetical protein [Chloroflexia bacterium]